MTNAPQMGQMVSGYGATTAGAQTNQASMFAGAPQPPPPQWGAAPPYQQQQQHPQQVYYQQQQQQMQQGILAYHINSNFVQYVVIFDWGQETQLYF